MTDRRWLRSRDLLAEFPIGKTKLYALIKKREIPCHRIDGIILFDRNEIALWLHEKKVA